jgi:hypothetical protein
MMNFGDLVSQMYSLESWGNCIDGEIETAQANKQYVGIAAKLNAGELQEAIKKYLTPGEKGEEPLIAQIHKMLKTIEKDEKISAGVRSYLTKYFKNYLSGLGPLVKYYNGEFLLNEAKQINETKEGIPKMEKAHAENVKRGKEFLSYIC